MQKCKLKSVFFIVFSLLELLGFASKGFAAAQGSLASSQAKIRVLSFKDGHSEAVAAKLEDFKKETGIEVILDLVPAPSVAAKTVADQAGGASYDAYLVDEPFLPQLSRFLMPMDQWPSAPSGKSDPYVLAALKASSYKGIQYGLPVNGNVYMYIYRKDLFSDPKEKEAFKAKYKAELREPQNASELLNVAEFFYRPPSLFGFAPFTKVSEGTTVEAVWLFAMLGFRVSDENGNLQLTAAQAAEAFDLYRRLMKFAPTGSKSWHHTERMSAYSKGSLAQMFTWPSFLNDLENPSKSLVVGKTAYGTELARSCVTGTWTYAISKSSKNGAAAAAFGNWWGGFDSGTKLVPMGMNPARKDLLSLGTLVEKNPWFPAVLQNFEKAQNRPRVADYKEVSNTISKIFSEAVSTEKSSLDLGTGLVAELGNQLKNVAEKPSAR